MDVYFELPHVGELELEHVFYMLDGEPILFVCTDPAGLRYLCSCCLMYEKWVVGQTKESALLDLIDDKVTIREVFEKFCGSKFLVSWNGETFSLSHDCPDSLLPRTGAMLELEREKTGAYRETLHRKKQQDLFQALEQAHQFVCPYLPEHIRMSTIVCTPEQSIASVAPHFPTRHKSYITALQTYQAMMPIAGMLRQLNDTDAIHNVVKTGLVSDQAVSVKMEKRKAREEYQLTTCQINLMDCFAG